MVLFVGSHAKTCTNKVRFGFLRRSYSSRTLTLILADQEVDII
jgi:hypothetical protein